MSYKTILVTLDDSTSGQRRLAYAAALAAQCGANLTGVYLVSPFLAGRVTVELPSLATPDVVRSQLKGISVELAAASASVSAALEAEAARAGVATEFVEVDGDFNAPLVSLARRHDLTIMPPSVRALHGHHTVMAANVAMANGGPVLILPLRGYEPSAGRRVMVAWKDTREAARAVQDAQPFLTHAEKVYVVSACEDRAPGHDAALRRRLQQFAADLEFVVNDRADTPTSDILKLELMKTGSDFLVIGLYGRSRLEELVLGGVSRNLLADPPCPLLVSH